MTIMTRSTRPDRKMFSSSIARVDYSLTESLLPSLGNTPVSRSAEEDSSVRLFLPHSSRFPALDFRRHEGLSSPFHSQRAKIWPLLSIITSIVADTGMPDSPSRSGPRYSPPMPSSTYSSAPRLRHSGPGSTSPRSAPASEYSAPNLPPITAESCHPFRPKPAASC